MTIWRVELCLGLFLAAGVLAWLCVQEPDWAAMSVATGILGVALRSRSSIRYVCIRIE
ncbi:hypothetical protein ACFWMJ_00650 [Streptomyces hawaiiensis]|jgi:hypothetical protein|uniref:hypothetical protein n=1 Tax=Streptomyces hawaiiensis TaxID=67305 RepID=UPI00365E776F